jgi:hypothetical protein
MQDDRVPTPEQDHAVADTALDVSDYFLVHSPIPEHPAYPPMLPSTLRDISNWAEEDMAAFISQIMNNEVLKQYAVSQVKEAIKDEPTHDKLSSPCEGLAAESVSTGVEPECNNTSRRPSETSKEASEEDDPFSRTWAWTKKDQDVVGWDVNGLAGSWTPSASSITRSSAKSGTSDQNVIEVDMTGVRPKIEANVWTSDLGHLEHLDLAYPDPLSIHHKPHARDLEHESEQEVPSVKIETFEQELPAGVNATSKADSAAATSTYAPSHTITFAPRIHITPERVKAPAAEVNQKRAGRSSRKANTKFSQPRRRNPRRNATRQKNNITKSSQGAAARLVPVVEIEVVRSIPIQSTARLGPLPAYSESTIAPDTNEKSSLSPTALEFVPNSYPETSMTSQTAKVKPIDELSTTKCPIEPVVHRYRHDLEYRLYDEGRDTRSVIGDFSERLHEAEVLCKLHHHRAYEKIGKVEEQVAMQKGYEIILEDLGTSLENTVASSTERIKRIDDTLEAISETRQWRVAMADRMKKIEELEERIIVNSESQPWQIENKHAIEELETKIKVLFDGQQELTRRVDHITRLAAVIYEKPSLQSPSFYPPKVIAAVTQHWFGHVLNAVKSLLPSVYSLRLYDRGKEGMTNIVTTAAAIAAIINIVSELLTYAAETTGDEEENSEQGSRVALRVYAVMYPTVRNALISIARMPGPWCRDAKEQRQATEELKSILGRLARKANMNDLSITIGDPFSGLTETSQDRWLPAISWGGAMHDEENILLSTPPLASLDDIDIHMCRHPHIKSWQNFLTRKFPLLALSDTPLFTEPSFPCPWTTHPSVAKSVDKAIEPMWTTGVESVEALISWVGRSLLTSGIQIDDDMTRHCSEHAITTYTKMRPDLCNAIDVTLRGEIAHGLSYIPAPLIVAARYIAQALEKLNILTGDEKRVKVEIGEELCVAHIEADDWMPRIIPN